MGSPDDYRINTLNITTLAVTTVAVTLSASEILIEALALQVNTFRLSIRAATPPNRDKSHNQELTLFRAEKRKCFVDNPALHP
jgi:hypothetical protein